MDNQDIIIKMEGESDNYDCLVCGRPFTTSDNLSKHYKLHQRHADSVDCEFCGWTFDSTGSIYLHKQKHHKEEMKAKGKTHKNKTEAQSAPKQAVKSPPARTSSRSKRPITKFDDFVVDKQVTGVEKELGKPSIKMEMLSDDEEEEFVEDDEEISCKDKEIGTERSNHAGCVAQYQQQLKIQNLIKPLNYLQITQNVYEDCSEYAYDLHDGYYSLLYNNDEAISVKSRGLQCKDMILGLDGTIDGESDEESNPIDENLEDPFSKLEESESAAAAAAIGGKAPRKNLEAGFRDSRRRRIKGHEKGGEVEIEVKGELETGEYAGDEGAYNDKEGDDKTVSPNTEVKATKKASEMKPMTVKPLSVMLENVQVGVHYGDDLDILEGYNYRCQYCELVTMDRDVHVKHAQSVHAVSVKTHKIYPCNICNKSYYTPFKLKDHLWIHEKPRYFCLYCKRDNPSKYEAKRHTLKCSMNTGLENLKSRFMEDVASGGGGSGSKAKSPVKMKFKSTQKMKSRNLGTFTERNPIQNLPRVEEIKQDDIGEKDNVELEEAEIPAPKINKKKLRIKDRNDEQIVDKEIYVCLIEDSQTLDPFEYFVYKCRVCSEDMEASKDGFDNSSEFIDHMVSFHSEKIEAIKYPCELCTKQFGHDELLRRHYRVHYTPRYHCSICKKAFFDSPEWDHHWLEHTDEKAIYQCNYCRKWFRNSQAFEKHVKIHRKSDFKQRFGQDADSSAYEDIDNTEVPSDSEMFESQHDESPERIPDDLKSSKPVKKVRIKEEIDDEDNDPDYALPSKTSLQTGDRKRDKKRDKTQMEDVEVGIHYGDDIDIIEGYQYTCAECSQEFTERDNFIAHVQREHAWFTDRDKAFMCNVCKLRFSTFANLKRHLWMHEKPRYYCKFCKRDFQQKIYCQRHTEAHFEDEAREVEVKLIEDVTTMDPFESFVYECTKCVTPYPNFMSFRLYKNHMADMHGVKEAKSLVLKCEKCEFTCDTLKKIKRHYRMHFPPRFRCSICNKLFHTQENWRHHWPIHTTQLKCGECGKSFTNQKMLKDHCSAHKGARRYECQSCSHAFVTQKAWHHHSMTCGGDVKQPQQPDVMEVICGLCNDVFESMEDLETHQVGCQGENSEDIKSEIQDVYGIVEGGQGNMEEELDTSVYVVEDQESTDPFENFTYNCQECASEKFHTETRCTEFQIKAEFMEHMFDIHQVNRTMLRYPCSICDKSYVSVYNLQNHYARHFPPRFFCAVCEKPFSDREKAEGHVQQRHKREVRALVSGPDGGGEKQFRCSHCGSVFDQLKALQVHWTECRDIENPLHSCAVCSLEFTSRELLLVHEKQHFLHKGEIVMGEKTELSSAIAYLTDITEDTAQPNTAIEKTPENLAIADHQQAVIMTEEQETEDTYVIDQSEIEGNTISLEQDGQMVTIVYTGPDGSVISEGQVGGDGEIYTTSAAAQDSTQMMVDLKGQEEIQHEVDSKGYITEGNTVIESQEEYSNQGTAPSGYYIQEEGTQNVEYVEEGALVVEYVEDGDENDDYVEGENSVLVVKPESKTQQGIVVENNGNNLQGVLDNNSEVFESNSAAGDIEEDTGSEVLDTVGSEVPQTVSVVSEVPHTVVIDTPGGSMVGYVEYMEAEDTTQTNKQKQTFEVTVEDEKTGETKIYYFSEDGVPLDEPPDNYNPPTPPPQAPTDPNNTTAPTLLVSETGERKKKIGTFRKKKPNANGLSCEQCGKTFHIRGRNFHKHMRSHKTLNMRACREIKVDHPDQVYLVIDTDKPDPFEEYYCHTCEVCGEEFSGEKLVDLGKHMEKKHGVSDKKKCEYACNKCERTFGTIHAIRMHYDMHFEARYGCSVCPAQFTLQDYFRPHKRIHLRDESEFQCTVCGKNLASLKTLQAHEADHRGERPHSCTHCGRSFTALANLRAHNRSCTAETPCLACVHCPNRSFKRRSNLAAHMQERHGEGEKDPDTSPGLKRKRGRTPKQKADEQESMKQIKLPNEVLLDENGEEVHFYLSAKERRYPIVCHKCPKRFIKKGKNYWQHQQWHQLEPRRGMKTVTYAPDAVRIITDPSLPDPFLTHYVHSCQLCERVFRGHNLGKYPKHLAVEHRGSWKDVIPEYDCDKCDRSFRIPTALRVHYNTHFEPRFKCSICPFKFTNKNYFFQHKLIHTQQNLRRFRCVFCGKKLASLRSLKAHEANHRGDKPFQCNHCERAFSRIYNLNKHYKWCTAEKPCLSCTLCSNKTFRSVAGLEQHREWHRLHDVAAECVITTDNTV